MPGRTRPVPQGGRAERCGPGRRHRHRDQELAEELAAVLGVDDVEPTCATCPWPTCCERRRRSSSSVDRAFVPMVDGVTIPLQRPVTIRRGPGAPPASPRSSAPTSTSGSCGRRPIHTAATSTRTGCSDGSSGSSRRGPSTTSSARCGRPASIEVSGPSPTTSSTPWSRSGSFRVHGVRLAEAQAAHAPTFVYLFEWGSPAMGGWLGACHGLEIAFAFGNQGRGGAGRVHGPGRRGRRPRRGDDGCLDRLRRTGDPSTPAARVADLRPRLPADDGVRTHARGWRQAPRDEEREAVHAAMFDQRGCSPRHRGRAGSMPARIGFQRCVPGIERGRRFEPEPQNVRVAREFVADTLEDDGSRRRHRDRPPPRERAGHERRAPRATPFEIVVDVQRAAVRVDVIDDDVAHPPEVRQPRPEDTNGRGLLIVDQLAAGWGSERGRTPAASPSGSRSPDGRCHDHGSASLPWRVRAPRRRVRSQSTDAR